MSGILFFIFACCHPLSQIPLVSGLQTLEANQQQICEEDNKLTQGWFGHLGTKESNKCAVTQLSPSIQNCTALEPLTLYLYIALSTGVGL